MDALVREAPGGATDRRARGLPGVDPRGRPALAWLLLTLAAAAVLLAACGGDPGGESGEGARAYRVRGRVESLPNPASGAGELRIRHEAIPDLVGASGRNEPMPAMSMPFPLADGVELAGIEVGDPVLFELRVDWQASRPVVVSAIEPLAPGTELALD